MRVARLGIDPAVTSPFYRCEPIIRSTATPFQPGPGPQSAEPKRKAPVSRVTLTAGDGVR